MSLARMNNLQYSKRKSNAMMKLMHAGLIQSGHHTYVLCEGGGGLNAFAKCIDPRQPAQSEQADMGRNFSTFANIPACPRTTLRH